MKRCLCVLLAVLTATLCVPTFAAAEEAFVLKTDYVYSQLTAGGKDNTVLYTAPDDKLGFVIGQLNETGEVSRTTYSAANWDAMLEPSVWTTTVHGDAGALCPYADTHADNTVCPYFDVILVTMKNAQNGVTLDNYYVESEAMATLPGGSVHFCWGRYGYEAPLTLKWDGENRYMALKNSDGLWGVFDVDTNRMVTDYVYANMSAVYGDYAKVYNGTAWGRLDLSGATATTYVYEAEEAFSVKEELRQVGDGQWQVFNADNEAISVVYDGSWASVSYAPAPHLMMANNNGGATVLYDLSGTAVATFDASKTVRYLQGLCYAVEAYDASGALKGTALGVAAATVQPDDTTVQGDVNLDGRLDSADVRLALRFAAGLTTLTARQQTAGDVSADGRLNSTDARLLLWQTTVTL